MTYGVKTIIIPVRDLAAAKALYGTVLGVEPYADEPYYAAAFGLGDKVRVRASDAPTTGFRGFTLSLVVSQPSTVDSLISTALAGGATTLKPAAKGFYLDHGLAVAKSFGSKYVEFDTPSSPIKLALYSRRAAAKDAGVPPEGTGSHRIVICSDAGPFTDPDGFAWEAAPL